MPETHLHMPHFGHAHEHDVAAAIDGLCTDKYAETSYDGLGELVDLIDSKSEPQHDVARAVQRHLQGDSVHAQKRALVVLEGIVEMGKPEFQRTFMTPTLMRTLQNVSQSFGTDNGVRRRLMLMLLSWHRHFMHDPEMGLVSSLYGLCGGVDRDHFVQKRETAKAGQRGAAQQHLNLLQANETSVGGTLDAANRECELLLQAVVSASRSGVPVMQHDDVKTHATLLLELQKSVVQYIHTVGDDFYLSALIETNDKIVDVLQRLQEAAAGLPVSTHPLGTHPASKEELIMGAARRLSVPDVSMTPTNHLLREVDHSLMVHSGFTSAAPSRPAEPTEPAGADEIDMSAVERNTQQVQGSVSGLHVPVRHS